jgi:hypothetical protein
MTWWFHRSPDPLRQAPKDYGNPDVAHIFARAREDFESMIRRWDSMSQLGLHDLIRLDDGYRSNVVNTWWLLWRNGYIAGATEYRKMKKEKAGDPAIHR